MCGGADGRGPKGGAGRAGSARRKQAPRLRRPEGPRAHVRRRKFQTAPASRGRRAWRRQLVAAAGWAARASAVSCEPCCRRHGGGHPRGPSCLDPGLVWGCTGLLGVLRAGGSSASPSPSLRNHRLRASQRLRSTLHFSALMVEIDVPEFRTCKKNGFSREARSRGRNGERVLWRSVQ